MRPDAAVGGQIMSTAIAEWIDLPTAEAPAAASKPAQILAAASKLFLSKGFGATSMDAVAREAGVSKATLYAHFSGKAELFGAIVRGECLRRAEGLSLPMTDAVEPVEALYRMGRAYLDLLLSEKALAAFRMVVAECQRFPELGQAFYQAGPATTKGGLATWLGGQHRSGRLDCPDPELVADQFLGMIRGHVHLRGQLCYGEPPGDAERDRLIRAAVTALVRAYAPADGRPT
ncbi:MAG: TetR family transcriptional regulator [Azospirillum sp.]|nr:TetR family transcriptional regulator [Azospirillum sp.]